MALSALLQSYILFRSTHRNTQEAVNTATAHTDQYITHLTNSIENVLNTVASNPDVQKFLQSNCTLDDIVSGRAGITSDVYSNWKISSGLLTTGLALHTDLVQNAALYNISGDLVMSFYRYACESSFFDYLWSDHIQNLQPVWVGNGNSAQIILARKVTSILQYSPQKNFGYLVLFIDREEMSNSLKQFALSSNSTLFILDENGQVLFSTDDNAVGRNREAVLEELNQPSWFLWFLGLREISAERINEHTQWKVLEVVDLHSFFSGNITALLLPLSVSLILLLLTILSTLCLCHIISRPVLELRNHLDQLGHGAISQLPEKMYPVQELNDLNSSFHYILGRLNRLILENAQAKIIAEQLQTKTVKAELDALQRQINPHFLYNTLDTLNWLIALDSNTEASEAIIALSDFYRYFISGKDSFSTIGEEIQNIKNYVHIQKIRFPKLQVTYEIDEDVAQCQTIRLLLQPLVENCVLHGVRFKGSIKVSIKHKENRLWILVSDTGEGMSQETLEKLMHGGNDTIGLTNVQERLSLYYGKLHTFHIQSIQKKGTSIEISHPYRKTDGAQDDTKNE